MITSREKVAQNNFLMKIMIVFLLFLVNTSTQICRESYSKVYPLSEDYFERVYLIYQNNNTYFLNLSCKEADVLSIAITEARKFREAPRFNIYGNHNTKQENSEAKRTIFSQCHVEVEVSSSTLLEVKRKQTKQTIFSICDLLITDGHKKITIIDDSVKWGLGQRFQQRFQVTDGHWTIWNRDRPWQIDYGLQQESGQTYGHQPVYLAKQFYRNLFHLVYFKNHHGILVQSSQLGSQLVFNTVGGNLHFLVFIGQQNPEELLQKYHQFIGKSHIPPFWSLGYHQSRWGYKRLAEVKQIIDNFNWHDLPIDAFWLDLDYMKNKMIFTIDQQAFPAKQLNSLFRRQNIKFVPLLDVAIAVKDHEAVILGKKMDIFLKNHLEGQYYYKGQVWPGEVYYIDYLHPNASEYWQIQLKRLNKKLNFSGIWLDMNEPTNFKRQSDPIYALQIQQDQGISTMTINVKVKHYQSKQDQCQLNHGQVHSYYGHLSTVPTFDYLSLQGRPFIVTRSNSVGTGVFAAHWTGDNVANWEFLKASINSNFLFQIFGIQMIGSDICGFYEDSDQDLCSRWMQLGSFYPFARNHNHEAALPQEPYMFGEDHIETSRKSLKTRYALLKQMYTWLLMKKGKGTFFRPLGFEFYQDQTTFNEFIMETQFLIGKSLMVTPILQPKTEQRVVYFPGEQQIWYQFQISPETGTVDQSKIRIHHHQWNYNVQNSLPNPPLTFLRSGYLLLTNYPENRSSKLSRNFFVFAAIKDNVSQGEILAIQDYQDNKVIQTCIIQDCVSFLKLKKQSQTQFSLSWAYKGNPTIYSSFIIKQITIISDNQVCVIQTDVLVTLEGFQLLQKPKLCETMR